MRRLRSCRPSLSTSGSTSSAVSGSAMRRRLPPKATHDQQAQRVLSHAVVDKGREASESWGWRPRAWLRDPVGGASTSRKCPSTGSDLESSGKAHSRPESVAWRHGASTKQRESSRQAWLVSNPISNRTFPRELIRAVSPRKGLKDLPDAAVRYQGAINVAFVALCVR